MKKMWTKRLFSAAVALMMGLSLLPASAFAADGNVAQIGSTEYSTLEEALNAAADSDESAVTINVLQDCTLSKSIEIPKDKTFTLTADANADVTITDTGRYGVRPNGSLTMENLTFETNGQIALNGTTSGGPFGREVIFRNVTLKMDGEMYQFNAKGYYCGAIFADSPAYIQFDHCNVDIKNYTSEGAAVRWNGKNGDTGYGIEITNGTTFTSSNCYSGFVGTLDLLVDSSTLNVTNHRGNGSNGSNYYIKNSIVNFSGNGSHGISAADLEIVENSKVTSDNNGLYGVYVNGDFLVDGTSTLTVTHNSFKGDYAGLKIYTGVTDGQVKSGAVVTITDNYCSGLSNSGKVTFEDGAKLTITDNYNDKGNSSNGGGVYNTGSANLTLPTDAVIYNNHADTAGDDIYNTGTITFGSVGTDWILNDCEHRIDGWYDDSANNRWEAHAEAPAVNHIEAVEAGTLTGGTYALKAAHGENALDKTDYPALDKKVQDNNDPDLGWVDDSVSAAAGETINFKLTSNVPKDLTNYLEPEEVEDPEVQAPAINALSLEDRGSYILTFHDKMDDNFVNMTAPVVVIDREGTEDDVTLDSSEGEYTYTTETGDGCDFHIVIDLADLYEQKIIDDEDIANATPIVVTYSADLSDDVDSGEFPNEAWVTYEGGTSSHDIVEVLTYAVKVYKYDQSTQDKSPLAGAEFTLTGPDGFSDTATSNAEGYAVFGGLDIGTYQLTETKAPEGYVASSKSLTVSIPTQAGADQIVKVEFANSPIPHTGGMGTTMFTVGGAAILAAAGALFVITRRKEEA